MVIRCGLSSDTESLALLVHAREGGDLAEHRRGAERELGGDRAKNLLLVAEVDGTLAAFGRARHLVPSATEQDHPAPDGWYLAGVIVAPGWRRRGIGAALTRERLAWIAEHADEAYYFASASNLASIEMHRRFGFAELTRTFSVPGVRFDRDDGILFRALLSRNPALAGP